jgi:hypothetical protein
MNKDARLTRDMELQDRLHDNIRRKLDIQREIRELQDEKKILDQQADDIWNDMSTEMHIIWITEGLNEKTGRGWASCNPGWKATRSGIQRIKK